MLDTKIYTLTPSPIGDILLVKDDQGLTDINFRDGKHRQPIDPEWRQDDTAFADEITQLKAYFAGTRQTFDLPLAPTGTPFQKKVWQALQTIPYGETISYGELAKRIGQPQASRAVGAANGRNPLPIIIPCHRVIGSNGTLTGYGGGLSIKKALLSLEQNGRLSLFDQPASR